MKCYECDGEFLKKTGALSLESDIIGVYDVSDVHYYKCNQCGELLLPERTLEAVEAKESEKLNQLIRRFPISDYIGSAEVANILGISRQAIHKHPRIRRGFIYSLKFEGRTVYHKKSVTLYKDTGDGRFSLVSAQTTQQPKYVFAQMAATEERQNITESIVTPQNAPKWHNYNSGTLH